jgi:uncharacterized integral membrane protein
VAVLDGDDRVSVRLYRLGLVLAAAGLTWLSVALLSGRDTSVPTWIVILATAIAVAHLHLYAKHIRRWITWAGWSSVVLAAAPVPWAVVDVAALGCAFVALSALALKEQYCFKIPFLRLQPVVLATSVAALLLGWAGPAGVLLAIAALLQALMAYAKLRMPLHYDIGNKAAYQI